MENKKKPAIRFKGFCDDWEQRKLGEVADLTSSKRVHAQDYVDSGIPFYRGKEISELREHKQVSEVLYITEDKYEEMAKLYGSPQVGDLLITAVGTIGNTWVVDNVPFYFKDGNLIWLKNIKCNPNYLDCVLSSDEGQKKIDASAIGSNQKALTMVKLNELKFMFPNDGEQVKISDCFRILDHLITLHQRKCDKLQLIKKSMLEKMFPQNSQNIPEVRFKGFTDAWEQRKLNEVVNVYDGVHQTPDYKDSGVMFLSVENISTLKSEKYISEEAFQRDYKVYPQKGDILMTRIGDVGTPNVVETTEKVAFYVSLALFKPTKINSYFLCNSIQSPLFQKGLKDRTLVTAIPQKINKDEIGKVNIILPTSSQEQQLIGEYFRNLDHLITLHQRKLEKLQKIKKSMLEKMFV